MNKVVEILLSTYNGEKYLRVQLDSILKQDHSYWRLVIRDDGSKDGTLVILNEYVQKYPDKISLLKDNEGNLGFSASFSKLVKQCSADYIMYCDQDDYWHPDKISIMLSVMLEEETNLPAVAHVVFSDLQLADSDMRIVSSSFLTRMRYSSRKGMQIFFLKNYVPGCNLLFNKTLVQQALKTNNIINLHDHWLLMVCSSIGKLTYVNKPLMDYRTHDSNAIGFIESNNTFYKRLSLFFKDSVKYGLFNKKYRNLLYSKNIEQMKNICNTFPAEVSKRAIAFSQTDKSNYFSRKIKNITCPYIMEGSLLKQLTYIICF